MDQPAEVQEVEFRQVDVVTPRRELRFDAPEMRRPMPWIVSRSSDDDEGGGL